MRQFDPIVKHLMDRFGVEFARLLFNEPGLEVLQRLDTQQSTIKVHQNDMTFKIRRANGEVLLHHIEVQTGDSTDIPMPLRVLGYASALVLRYKLPVYSMVIYLSPDSGLTDPGTYGYEDTGLGLRLISEETMQESPFYEIVLQRGIEQGMAQGIEQGETRAKQASLLKLLKHKFRNVPETMITQIQAIQDPAQLDAIFEKSLTAETLEDIDILFG